MHNAAKLGAEGCHNLNLSRLGLEIKVWLTISVALTVTVTGPGLLATSQTSGGARQLLAG